MSLKANSPKERDWTAQATSYLDVERETNGPDIEIDANRAAYQATRTGEKGASTDGRHPCQPSAPSC